MKKSVEYDSPPLLQKTGDAGLVIKTSTDHSIQPSASTVSPEGKPRGIGFMLMGGIKKLSLSSEKLSNTSNREGFTKKGSQEELADESNSQDQSPKIIASTTSPIIKRSDSAGSAKQLHSDKNELKRSDSVSNRILLNEALIRIETRIENRERSTSGAANRIENRERSNSAAVARSISHGRARSGSSLKASPKGSDRNLTIPIMEPLKDNSSDLMHISPLNLEQETSPEADIPTLVKNPVLRKKRVDEITSPKASGSNIVLETKGSEIVNSASALELSHPNQRSPIELIKHSSGPIDTSENSKRRRSPSGSQEKMNDKMVIKTGSHLRTSSNELSDPNEDLPSTPAMKRKIGSFLKTHFPEERPEQEGQQRGLLNQSPFRLKGILAALDSEIADVSSSIDLQDKDLVHKEVMIPIHPRKTLRIFDFWHHDHQDDSLSSPVKQDKEAEEPAGSLHHSNTKKHFHLFEHLLHHGESKKQEESDESVISPTHKKFGYFEHFLHDGSQFHEPVNSHDDSNAKTHDQHSSKPNMGSEHEEIEHHHNDSHQKKYFQMFSQDAESSSHKKEHSTGKFFEHVFHPYRNGAHDEDGHQQLPHHPPIRDNSFTSSNGRNSINQRVDVATTPPCQPESVPPVMSLAEIPHSEVNDQHISNVSRDQYVDSSDGQHWHLPKFHFKRARSTSQQNQNGGGDSASSSNSETLTEKYGKKDAIIGKGAYAKVRVVHKPEKDARWYAVKEFRKKKKEESEKDYVKKVIAEFCISSSLRHPNVVEYLDLIKDENGRWCEVMEYCAGGDLLHKIQVVGLSGNDEVYCLFKQLLNGVSYIHSVGVVHRDLKPENILLDHTHRFIKITDFGVATVFRTQWEQAPHLVHGIAGSAPYIAPEEWKQDQAYLPTKVDIWACGMIFYAMLGKGMLWATAQDSDPNYTKYIKRRETGYPPFEIQDPDPKRLLYLLMDPDPKGRPEANQLLEDKWVHSFVNMCISAAGAPKMSSHDALQLEIAPPAPEPHHLHLTCPPPLHHH